MEKVLKASREDGTAAYLTSMVDAAKLLNVPTSTLAYRVLKGDLQRVQVGNYKLVDVESARRVLQEAGYKPRERSANKVAN
ncbi:MAG TPA: hypothetical protein VF043_07710 [Ktedonobacteraceae bacterium]